MVFDPIVANPGRLRILAALADRQRQPFVQVRAATGLTDGNLCTHARRLHAAGLVAIEKSLAEGKMLTTMQLTLRGRDALAAHAQSLLAALESPDPAPAQEAAAAEDDSDWVD